MKDGCPFDCGLCVEHRQYPCSVLLEVTHRCTLGCPVCFADTGSTGGECVDLDIAARVTESAGQDQLNLCLQLLEGEEGRIAREASSAPTRSRLCSGTGRWP